MAGVRRFQDLIAWPRCMELSKVIFEITETGPASRDLKFRQQIRNAAQSSGSLVAEGFVRFLPGDFVRYLRMTRARNTTFLNTSKIVRWSWLVALCG
jgi:hypothetical protein